MTMKKALYQKSDIIYINGDESNFISREYVEILEYIDKWKLGDIVNLTNLLRQEGKYNLLKYVSKNTFYVQCYLTCQHDKIMDDFKNMKSYIDNCLTTYELYGYFTLNRKMLDLFEKYDIIVDPAKYQEFTESTNN